MAPSSATREWLLGAFGLLGIFVLAHAAEATPARGGSGGSPFNLDCGGDSVLAGVAVRAGALVDAVEAQCVKVGAGGSWSGGPAGKGRAGGSGGSPVSMSCDKGSAVTGIHGGSGALVDRLGIRCGTLGVEGGVVKVVKGGARHGPAGGKGGAAFDDACPGGQVGRGLKGRAGALIDQIELVCHNPSVPRSQPARIERPSGVVVEQFKRRAPGSAPSGPTYDMEVVSVNPTMRELDLSGQRYGLWEVTLRNNGNAEVLQAGVECRAGALVLRSLSGGSRYQPGDSKTFTVQHRLPDLWSAVTSGDHSGNCTVSIVQPTGVTDANAANSTRNATFTVPQRTSARQPDLYINEVTLRDCATRGAATALAPVCAEVVGGNGQSGTVESAWQVGCTLGSRTASAAGFFPLPRNRTLLEKVRFENVAAGEYTLTCTLDATNQLAESNETNNSRTVTVAVRAAAPTYDMEVVSINSTMQELDLGSQSYALWDVTLRNNGDADVVQAGVECRAGAMVLRALSGGSTYGPGQSRTFTVQHRLPDLWQVATVGNHSGACTVSIVQPTGAADANAANNTRSGTFTVVASTRQPDVYVTSLALRDCATRGVARTGAAVCADIEGGNGQSGPVWSAWQIRCTLGDRTATAAGPSPMPANRTLLERVRFENVPAGSYTLACTLDSGNQLAESNENNNTRSADVTVTQ